MVLEAPQVNTLEGGWYVQFKSGDVITEAEMDWIQVPNKKDIKLMGLKRMHKRYEIENKTFCSPGETHMREIIVNPGGSVALTKQTLVSWFIGYYEQDGKVIVRIDATTGKVTTEKIPYTTAEEIQPE
jgi:hypothetical protein